MIGTYIHGLVLHIIFVQADCGKTAGLLLLGKYFSTIAAQPKCLLVLCMLWSLMFGPLPEPGAHNPIAKGRRI